MPLYTLTSRVLDDCGCVRAVKQAPFFVLCEGEGYDDAERQLLDAAEQLEELAEEIAEAQFNPDHHHHHWWLP